MLKPSLLIAFFTTIIRYYDYALFGLSASILAQNFLPTNNHDVQLLNFFAIFGAVVIARPLGSLILGYIGDKYGRINSIKISILMSAIATSLIAITPNFVQIGKISTITLIFSRMIFLISLAGEVDAIKIYVAEKASKTNKNFNLGIVASCSQVGALLAAIAYYYASYNASSYLWRLNFLIGSIFCIITICFRKFFQESSEFLDYKNKYPNTRVQISSDIKATFILAILINGAIGGIYHFLVIFLGVFLSKITFVIKVEESHLMNIILITTYGISAILSGFLADKVNPLKQIISALILSLIIGLIMQILLYKQIFSLFCPTILIALTAFYTVPLQPLIQSLFSPLIKMRLYSLSHSIGSLILSSTSPFFSMLLWKNFKSLPLTLSFFIGLLIILTCSVITLQRIIISKLSN